STGNHVFVASGLSPACVSPVARVSETPPTLTVVVAWIVVVPAVGELITTVQEPDPDAPEPGVVQLLGPTQTAVAPPELVSEAVIEVPSGAFANEPDPLLTLTCRVSVWFVPTGFVAVCGVIWMFASTNVFTASGELPFWPFV